MRPYPFLVLFALAGMVLSASAQTPPPRQGPAAKPNPERAQKMRQEAVEIKTRMQEHLLETRENLTDKRATVRERLVEQKQDMAAALQARREEAKARIEAGREAFREQLEERKAAMRANMEERKAKLRENLLKIKDERKQQVVDRVDTNLNAINERRVEFFASAVDQIERVLDAVESRTDKAEANGRDVTEVRAKIAAAETKILDARAAISLQAENTYDISVSGEATLRTDVSAARDSLKNDLKTLHEAVKAAHQAVREAATTLAGVPGIDAIVVVTSTASSTQ